MPNKEYENQRGDHLKAAAKKPENVNVMSLQSALTVRTLSQLTFQFISLAGLSKHESFSARNGVSFTYTTHTMLYI